MNILFLTQSIPNYVPDFLLHGLRKLYGDKVVDYPKKECLYSGIQHGRHPEIYREPFWFPVDNGMVDRDDIENKLKNKFFDYVVCDIYSLSFFNSMLSRLSGKQLNIVLIDGDDFPAKINPGSYVICRRETDGTDYSIPLPMALPEEVFDRISSYNNNPKSYSVGFLGAVGEQSESRYKMIEKIASYYPDSLLQTSTVSGDEDKHSVKRVGFDSYYDSLQRCKVVLTLRGAGYDTFRFWENAACNALHVSEKMPLFIPNDFEDKQDIIRFSDIDKLRVVIDSHLSGSKETGQIVQNSRQHLKGYHLTTSRAIYFIDRIKRAFNQ